MVALPKFNFCDCVYGPCLTAAVGIQKIQICCILYGLNYKAHVSYKLRELKGGEIMNDDKLWWWTMNDDDEWCSANILQKERWTLNKLFFYKHRCCFRAFKKEKRHKAVFKITDCDSFKEEVALYEQKSLFSYVWR